MDLKIMELNVTKILYTYPLFAKHNLYLRLIQW